MRTCWERYAALIALGVVFRHNELEIDATGLRPITFGQTNWEAHKLEVDQMIASRKSLVRHEGHVPRERSACGWRDRLISREDAALEPAAWAHAVDIDGAKPHYHKVATELYYVLEGCGSVILDGVAHEVRNGSLVHIPPGVVHSALGKMRVLVIGIPDISDADYFEAVDK